MQRDPLSTSRLRPGSFVCVEISTLGDSALLIDFADESSDPGMLLQRALSAADALERSKLPGVVEITSAYQSVAIFVDETNPEVSDLTEHLLTLLTSHEKPRAEQRAIMDIPVCYEGEFALDAARIASETKLPFTKIIELHCSIEFKVAGIGFTPGFPYLAGLPEKLRVPRLPTPRTKVPAGSVGIANAQAGIYPFESPGGWNIIGRTPLRLFDPTTTPPALLTPGDRVRFRQITRAEFDVARANEI